MGGGLGQFHAPSIEVGQEWKSGERGLISEDRRDYLRERVRARALLVSQLDILPSLPGEEGEVLDEVFVPFPDRWRIVEIHGVEIYERISNRSLENVFHR